MNRIISAFKNLYTGEDVLKKHLWLVSLFILSAISYSFLMFLDKDTPMIVVSVCLLLSIVFFILSIVPGIFGCGLFFDFCNSRLNDCIGIPKLTIETFITGVKALPLGIVWGIYSILFVGILFVLPFVLLLIKASHEPLLFLVSILVIPFWLLFAIALFYILSPFLMFVYLKYSENYAYSPELFNPLLLFEFMKKSFKQPLLIALKFILVNMVVGTITSIIAGIPVVINMFIIFFAALFSFDNEILLYTPPVMISILIFSVIAIVLQAYSTTIVSYAYVDNLSEVYKKEIRQTDNDE